MSKEMQQQIMLVHQMIAAMDELNRKICVTLLQKSVYKA